MALFENFPYTNLHSLNLDWIIKKIKADSAKLEAMGVDIEAFRAYIENIDAEIEQKIQEDIPPAVQEAIDQGIFDVVLANARKRRIVMIGDSYGAGWTPDGEVTGYPGIVKNALRIPNADFFEINKGGARFGAASGSEYAFDEVLSGALSSITEKGTITDIVFAGGYNDAGASYEDINAGIARCKSVIAANFSNPSLKVHLFAIGYHCANKATRQALYRRYCACYAKSGWAYTKLTTSICYSDWWASDGYHPLQDAQYAIARNISNILMGGTKIDTAIFEEYADTNETNVTWYSLMCDGFFDSFLYGGGFSYATPISLSRGSYTKICEITSKLPLDNISDSSLRQMYVFDAITAQTGNVYRSIRLMVYFEQTARNTYAMYGCISDINDEHTNYLTLSNVTSVQSKTNTWHIQMPYNF